MFFGTLSKSVIACIWHSYC